MQAEHSFNTSVLFSMINIEHPIEYFLAENSLSRTLISTMWCSRGVENVWESDTDLLLIVTEKTAGPNGSYIIHKNLSMLNVT